MSRRHDPARPSPASVDLASAPIRRMPIPAERQARVIEIIRRENVASIHSIASALGASPSTVRRDLDELAEKGYLERTHGGAVFRWHQHPTFEPSREIAEHMSLPAKRAIGRFAADLIDNGQSVIFDSSSTVLEAARRVAERAPQITAVTNDLGIAQVLSRAEAIRLIVSGGTLRARSLTLMGEPGISLIGSLTVDIAFIGIHSLANLKPSETTLEVVAMKQALIRTARQVVLLVDSSKFDSPAFCTVCRIECFHRLITDDRIPDETKRACEERGIAVTVVRSDRGAA